MSTVPFIQLFILTRLVQKLSQNNKLNVLTLFDQKDKLQQVHSKEACEIVDDLIEDGIAKYMENKYKDNKCIIISSLFSKMIRKYPKEYEEIVSYHNLGQSRYYESELFGQSDLVPKILQFLPFESLNNCCLVNSIWLYHGYNINSIYFFNLNTWIIVNCKGTHGDACDKRFWHRMVNVRKIRYYGWTNENKITQSCIDGYQSLQKLEYIDIQLNKYMHEQKSEFKKGMIEIVNSSIDNLNRDEEVSNQEQKNNRDRCLEIEFVDVICKHRNISKLKHFCCGVADGLWGSRDVSKLPQEMDGVRLDNCETIELRRLALPIICTNKCIKLSLHDLDSAGYKWCKGIINNCDFTNIQTLVLDRITLDFGIRKEGGGLSLKEESINMIAAKLVNLKYFAIKSFDDDILIFWQALKMILIKNNVMVRLNGRIENKYEGGWRNIYSDSKLKFDQFYQSIVENELINNVRYLELRIGTSQAKNCRKMLSTPTIQSNVEKLYLIPGSQRTFEEIFSLTKVEYRAKRKEFYYPPDNDNDLKQESETDWDIRGKFDSLMEIHIGYSVGGFALSNLVDFLNCQLSSEKNKVLCFFNVRFSVTFDVNFDAHYKRYETSNVDKNIGNLFQTVYKMIENEIPLNISVKFHQYNSKRLLQRKKNEQVTGNDDYDDGDGPAKKLKDIFDKYYIEHFEPLFGKWIPEKEGDYIGWKHFKTPKFNKYCQKSDAPKIEFNLNDYNKAKEKYKADIMYFKAQTAQHIPSPID